jgi:hypothetical protein
MTDLTPDVARILQYRAVAFSKFIDSTYAPDVSPEAVNWRRIMKVVLEAAEAQDAYANLIGENFRKGRTGTGAALIGELMDAAFAALCAAEHMTDHQGDVITHLMAKTEMVMVRAGLEPFPSPVPSPDEEPIGHHRRQAAALLGIELPTDDRRCTCNWAREDPHCQIHGEPDKGS